MDAYGELKQITLPHSYTKFYHVLRNANAKAEADNWVTYYVGIVEDGKKLTAFKCYIENSGYISSTTFFTIGI